jgi:hypothetical protein
LRYGEESESEGESGEEEEARAELEGLKEERHRVKMFSEWLRSRGELYEEEEEEDEENRGESAEPAGSSV